MAVGPRDAHGEDEIVARPREARVRRLGDDEDDVLERAVRALVADAGHAHARAVAPARRDVHVELHGLLRRAGVRVGVGLGWEVERAGDAVPVRRAEVEVFERGVASVHQGNYERWIKGMDLNKCGSTSA